MNIILHDYRKKGDDLNNNISCRNAVHRLRNVYIILCLQCLIKKHMGHSHVKSGQHEKRVIVQIVTFFTINLYNTKAAIAAALQCFRALPQGHSLYAVT